MRRGVALLDREYPGWDRVIDLETLDVASYTDDILGQLYGSYNDGVAALGFALGSGQSSPHGFTHSRHTEHWRRVVADRRAGDPGADDAPSADQGQGVGLLNRAWAGLRDWWSR